MRDSTPVPARPSPTHVADSAEIIAALDRLAPTPGAVLAFDADGTIWAGDVAEDVLAAAVAADWLKPEARPPMAAFLQAHGLDTTGSASVLAARIEERYRHGELPELPTYEMMAWCYAGYTEAEFSTRATDVLRSEGLPDRVRPAIGPLLAYAAERELRVQVVSASPIQVVRAGLELCGLRVDGVIAATPAIDDGLLAPRMAEPMPYGPQKVIAARAALGDLRWLASFGDSAFDFELLAAAELAVIVGARPALRARLGELSRDVLIYEP